LITSYVHAQKEKWDTYLAMYGTKPGSVLVDMALAKAAPDKKMPYLVITGPRAHSCNAKGVPAAAEIDKLEEILDNASSYLGGITASKLAGTFTYNCERLNYYYVVDTTGVRNALVRMYSKSYPDYDHTIKIKHDPTWIAYRTFLYPDEKTQRWMENSKIITTMLEMGDSLTTKRNINFKFHFQGESARTLFAAAARSRDYKADKLFTTGDGLVYGIAVSKYDNVRIGLVDSMATELQAEAAKYGGIYIGWEAPIPMKMK
jgi:hypothetical protein